MQAKRLLLFCTFLCVVGSVLMLTTSSVSSSPSDMPPLQPTRRPPVSPFPSDVQSDFEKSSSAPYGNYVRITDDSESISMRVPAEWHDVETGHWIVKGQDVGVFLAAAPDLHAFYASSSASGVYFGASRVLAGSARVSNPALMLNPAIIKLLSDERESRSGQKCRDGGRFAYEDEFYRGQYDVYLDCVEAGQGEIVLVTMPAHQEFITYLRVAVFNENDLTAAARIFDTYQVVNPSLKDEHDP